MDKKIRILFLESHLSTGGGPSFALKRIESLINYDKFELFVVEYNNLSDDFVVQKNKIKNLIKRDNFFTLGENKMYLIDIIKDNKIDIIHLDEVVEIMGIDVNIINELYSLNRNWKIVETCHNSWFDGNKNKTYKPDAYAFCTPYHILEKFSKTDVYSQVIEYPIEYQVPSASVKLKHKILLGMDPNKKHVINVGLWCPWKNQAEVLNIARLMENDDVVFHFIGNQAINFINYWEPLMKDLPKNVKIWLERSDVENFLKAGDLFLFTSLNECNPIVLKESISYGLPILSRNLPQYKNVYDGYIMNIDGDVNLTRKKILENINKKVSYSTVDEVIKFRKQYIQFYTDVYMSVKITINFSNGPYVEINGNDNSLYKIEVYDESGKLEYFNNSLKINSWINVFKKYYKKWNIKIYKDNILLYEHTLDLKDKNVLISLESKALGDTLMWFPYVKEFKDKHQCNVFVSTFHNYLFEESYPDINFISPGESVHNIHACYKIGWFNDKDGKIDLNRNPVNYRSQTLQKTASDILGLDFKEIRPKIKLKNTQKFKRVGIAINSTAQCKYWNCQNGWQMLVDYLKDLGYEIILYSKEENGYMGNYYPNGVNRFKSDNLKEIAEHMSSCEFFIGLTSGLSCLAWSINIPVIIISGITEKHLESWDNVIRIINEETCHGCFNRHKFDPGDWNWCPEHKGTYKQFECTKWIMVDRVIDEIVNLIKVD
jgi:autotransporter strand-loop-strand O-heptosyltransferase